MAIRDMQQIYAHIASYAGAEGRAPARVGDAIAVGVGDALNPERG